MKNAIVLVSGGLDSATALAMAVAGGYGCLTLSFDYGQRHAREIAAAAELAKHFKVREHITQTIDLRAFGGSALTDSALAVPKDSVGTDGGSAIPITYVPARNTVFLSFALAFAETRGAFDIFIGVNAVDYSGYPDCRPEFIEAFGRLANLATRAGVERAGGEGYRIHAPLIQMSKAQIIRKGLELGVPFEKTHSCYDPVTGPDGRSLSCGHCDSCLIRLGGFREVGVKDPVGYVGQGTSSR